MKKRTSVLLVLVMIFSFFVLPLQAYGATATINPDVTAIPGFPQTQDSLSVYGWITELNKDYTVTWSDLDPSKKYAFVNIADISSLSVSGTTATLAAKSIQQYDHENGNPTIPGVISALIDITSGQNGPPPQANGMWMSTNATGWEVMPGEMGDNGKPKSLKIQVTGPSGVEGFFKWYWPKGLLDFVGITADDLAGFVDNDQTTMNVTKYADGSALISFSLTYSTHVLKTGKALPISLAANKKSISKKAKNKNVRFYGWLGSKKAKKEVQLYRKLKGEKKYSLVKAVIKSAKKGSYSKTIKVDKTASFYTKTLVGKKFIKSPAQTITVK